MNAEEKQQSEELLADFRHRLRTPLNHIIGYSDLLLEEAAGLEAESIAQLESIRANAHLVLEQVQHRLAPGDNQTPREKMEALRTDVTDALDLIIGNAGKLAQKVHGGTLLDVLRIAVAGRDLLAFIQSTEAFGRVRSQSSLSTNFVSAPIPALPSRLLVVDDDETNCEVLQRQLERGGHTVTCVASGSEAIDRLRNPVFDLVLLDVMMPGMSGFEVLQHFKASENLANIPVIMMSALDELEIAAHCIQMGAEDYLLKPFDPVLLRARLHSALERKRLHEAAKERTAELERASQRLARANEDLNRFAFAASHDLQEPLRTITTTLQLLARQFERELAPEQNTLLDLAIDGARRMSHLIKDLLAYSVATSRERVREMVDGEATLEDALTNLRQSIDESGAAVTHDPLPQIFFDRAQLGQLFQNLIGNAIKYRGERRPEVHVAARQEDQHWLFSVTDNGMGIEDEYRQTIFEPFRRLHGKGLPGTGLGLAICARIVEGFGGRIWVDSEPGRGSVFYFTVNLQEPSVEEASKTMSAASHGELGNR
jgi:two-component system, sensor histidine kinase and response regulator